MSWKVYVVNEPETSSKYDGEKILREWDAKHEQGKSDFLDFLYALYKPEDHCYTGLYQRFSSDLIESFRDAYIAGDLDLSVKDLLDDPLQSDPVCEPLCDV
jgi:hypothetical protein